MALTKQWATDRGYDYQFLDDVILETVPDWYRAKAGRFMTVVTDLARIQRARKFLNSGYDQAVWVDADVLIFNPRVFSIEIDEPYAFCNELWLRPSSEGIAWDRRINNCVSVYKKGNAFLDFHEHACLRLVGDPKINLTHVTVGTSFLTQLNSVMALPVLTNVGCFSPHVLFDIAQGDGPYLAAHRQLFGSPIQAANLCASMTERTYPDHRLKNGFLLDEPSLHAAIDRLHSTQGEQVSVDLKRIFTKIYDSGAWGGVPGTYYSGSGSDDAASQPYVDYVRQFIIDQGICRVVDLGCGDFRVGQRLRLPRVLYTGVDVVDGLIAHNQKCYADDNTRFECLDITRDELPPGDLCLVRQVFQHLSNHEIASILKKLSQYRYVLVTEHYPAPQLQSKPNLDKMPGMDTRVTQSSAVCIEQPPFGLESVRCVLSVPATPVLVAAGETIRTFLWQNANSSPDDRI